MLAALWYDLSGWFREMFLTENFFFQLAAFSLIFIFSFLLTKKIQNAVERKICKSADTKFHHMFWPSLSELILPVITFLFLGIYLTIAESFKWPDHPFIKVFQHLLILWIIITAIGFLLGNKQWVKKIKIIALLVAGLGAFGFLGELIAALKDVGLSFGATHISFYIVLKSLGLLILLIWSTLALSNLFERGLKSNKDISPSLKILLVKMTKFSLLIAAILIALNATGINLTALTFFGGAIGVGLGFGLRDTIANFIGGIILLTDNSIKPGDVIGISGTYGWVNKLSARYISVITRDGREHLIPNTQIINEKVENWSFSNRKIRIRIPINISYKSDPNKALALIKDAAKETPRVLQQPEPKCLIREFGESAIKLELRFWIGDPANGMGSIQHAVLLNVWNKFKKHKIILPFPQRDVHLYKH